MGAWDVGYFDNDDAGSFMMLLGDDPSWSTVKGALAAVLNVGAAYLDMPEGGAAVAAAAVVANRKFSLMVSEVPNDLELISKLPEPPAEIVALALRALRRVRTEPSELLNLWEDAGEKDAWIATLATLERALSQ